jgi:hypothetical protein
VIHGDLGLDGRVGRLGQRSQQAVERADGPQLHTVPRRVEHAQPAEAESDGRHCIGVDRRQLADRDRDADDSVPQRTSILEELVHRRRARVGPRDRDRTAEEVDGNRLVAYFRQQMAEGGLRVAAALHAMDTSTVGALGCSPDTRTPSKSRPVC